MTRRPSHLQLVRRPRRPGPIIWGCVVGFAALVAFWLVVAALALFLTGWRPL